MPPETPALPPTPLPDAMSVPDDVIAGLEAEIAAFAADHEPEKQSAVERLKLALGCREQAVRARLKRDALVSMKQAGLSNRKIAQILGVKETTVRINVWRARQAGQLNDLRDILEHDVSALAVDTITHHLKRKDKDVAIEHLKGVGLYVNHSNRKNEGGGPGFVMPPLQVNVVVQNQGGATVTPETFDVSEGEFGVAREDAD